MSHFEGTLEAIFVSERSRGDPGPVEGVEAVAGQGLQGDRYFGKRPRGQVTLIEAEAIEGAAREYDVELEPVEARRNLLTRGVPLNHLVGREFTVGKTRMRGTELCEPCGFLEKVTGQPCKAALRHRGGLRAEVLEGGPLAPGDVIRSA